MNKSRLSEGGDPAQLVTVTCRVPRWQLARLEALAATLEGAELLRSTPTWGDGLRRAVTAFFAGDPPARWLALADKKGIAALIVERRRGAGEPFERWLEAWHGEPRETVKAWWVRCFADAWDHGPADFRLSVYEERDGEKRFRLGRPSVVRVGRP